MTDGLLLTISKTDFTTTVEQLKQNYSDGLAIVAGIESALGITPPPPPPPSVVLMITPGLGQLTDKLGDVWNLDINCLINRNGKMAYRGWQAFEMALVSGTIYMLGIDAKSWFSWNGADFVPSPAPAGV